MAPKLVLMRHGQSAWNERNLFTGWVDIPLSEEGIRESIEGGKKISDLPIDVIFTSSLVRSHMTLALALLHHSSGKIPVFQHPGGGKLDEWGRIYSEEAKKGTIPVYMAWELNERMYGRLQGLDKAETAKKYGDEQVHIWRRSFDTAPPEGESLAIVAERTFPYFQKQIVPLLEKGKSVFVVAHGNSLRSIVMHLDHLSKEEVVNLEIATGEPLVYALEKGKMGEKTIELNAHDATHPCGPALERMGDSLQEEHLASRAQMICDLAGARKDDVFVFTSSGAEAVNQVLWSVFLEISRKEGKCHFVASAIEDAPSMQMLKRLEDLGCYVKIAPVNGRGQIDVGKLAELVNPRTALISVSMAQGLTGAIQPVEEIARIAEERGVLLHLEGTAAMGKYYFSFAESKADYLTFSGDRIHSVPGSGGLFAKKGAPLVPLILGGSGYRGGAFDAPSYLALCAAAAQASLFLDGMSLEVARLRDLFEQEIFRLVPGAKVLFKDSLRLPNTTAIAFPRAHHEALFYLLGGKVAASIGGTYSQHLQSLLSASGIEEDCAVSFALSRMTTEEEVRRAAFLVSEAVAQLRSISRGIFDDVV